jgi:serine/threonine protein kinase
MPSLGLRPKGSRLSADVQARQALNRCRGQHSQNLHHEHIVHYHDCTLDRDAGTLYIFMELSPSGDLPSLIKRSAHEAERAGMPPRGLDEEKACNILMQLSSR